MVKRIVIRMLLLAGVLLCSGAGTATSRQFTDFYTYCSQLPTRDLFEKGEQYSTEQQKDSAFICYNIIIGRYDSKLADREKRICLDACLKQWEIYFFKFFDNKKSLEILSKATDIARDLGEKSPVLEFDYGVVYMNLVAQTGRGEYKQKAMDHLREAVRLSVTTHKNPDIADYAFGNLIQVASDSTGMRDISEVWNIYQQLPADESNPYRTYNKLLYTGYNNLYAGQYDRALECFSKQAEIKGVGVNRFSTQAWANMARVHAMQGNYRKALECLDYPLEVATSVGIMDVLMSLYETRADYLRNLGDSALADEFDKKSMAIKDELIAYREISNLNEASFIEDLNKAEQAKNEIEMRNARLMRTMISVLMIVIIISVLLYILFRNNRALRAANKTLYEKNVELLRLEDRTGIRAEQQVEISTSPLVSDTIHSGEEESAPAKYRGSNLTDQEKRNILARITKVMEESEEIYTADFTGKRLAELVGAPYNYISQVINELLSVNFNTFLNRYRIKEACRRMNDSSRYTSMTIEAIACEVGIKSRTTFTNAFKTETGLTPSKYIKLATETRSA